VTRTSSERLADIGAAALPCPTLALQWPAQHQAGTAVLARGIRMGISLAAKIAAFCRELGDDGDDSLRAMARVHNVESVFTRAEDAVQSGQLSPELEADLDSLDKMVKNADGQGLYPTATRGYTPLPWKGGGSGAQWWTCPQTLCAGRGRVQTQQQPPFCAATGQQLVPGPLPE
jgi:hypothetical protein